MKETGQVELTPEEIEELIQRLDTETLRGDDLPTIKAIPGRAAGYPVGSPTDPNERN